MNTQQITPETKRALCKLIYSKPVKAHFDKAELVLEHTNARTDSISEMLENEALRLKLYLVPIVTSAADAKREAQNRQRRKVIAHLKSAGFTKPDGSADMDRIYNWVETNFKAHLNSLDSAQLSKVIVAAEGVERSNKKALYNHA